MILELPFPPSVNGYWRMGKLKNMSGNRMMISESGRKYRTAVLIALRAHKTPTLTQPLSVVVDLYPPDNRRRDIDNYTKGLYDALTHAKVWQDDNLVREHSIRFQPKEARGRVVLTISTLEESEL